MENCGIYKIINVETMDMYIGSSKNVKRRWIIHKSRLNHNNHHNIYLQRSWMKYGLDKFKFEIIELLDYDPILLFEREAFWISELKPEYNLGSVGGGDMLSEHPNKKEICRKISEGHRRFIESLSEKEIHEKYARYGNTNPNWRGGVSSAPVFCIDCGCEISRSGQRCLKCSNSGTLNAFFGKHHSEEFRRKASERMRGVYKGNQRKRIKIDDVIYESCSAAAKALEVSPALITHRLKKNPDIYQILDP